MRVSLCRTVSLLSVMILLATGCGPQAEPPGDGQDTVSGGGTANTGASSEDEGTGQPAEQQEADASVADPTREDADLVIWADEARADALRPLADSFADDHAATVAVQAVPFEQIRDQVQVVAPDGDGPDVLVGDHDWLGELVPAGVVAPVDLDDAEAEFAEVAVSAVTSAGRTYGVPYAISSVALVRNTRHAPAAPTTWEELEETARTLQRRGTVPVGLAVPGDPYHLYPLVTALGGYLFGRGADGDDDLSDLGIDSPGSLEAAQRFREWAAEGLVDFAGSGAEAQERFAAGDAAFAILDPAAIGPDGHGLAGSGIPYDISAVPPVDGGTARPFVSVEALMVSAFAADADLARRFVVDSTTTGGAQAALASAAGLPPAHLAAADAAADDPDIAGLAASARDGVPLPAAPQAASAWGPWAEALEQVRDEGADPREALSAAADEVRELIGG